ncbi:hypothetical protein G6F68_013264 [Rhizopus microsporus]|nr:hypothetical protein G6F68_013264 [Rhizopus microsporus]
MMRAAPAGVAQDGPDQPDRDHRAGGRRAAGAVGQPLRSVQAVHHEPAEGAGRRALVRHRRLRTRRVQPRHLWRPAVADGGLFRRDRVQRAGHRAGPCRRLLPFCRQVRLAPDRRHDGVSRHLAGHLAGGRAGAVVDQRGDRAGHRLHAAPGPHRARLAARDP